MCQETTRDLALTSSFSRMVVASNVETDEDFVKALGDGRFSFLKLDVSDFAKLVDTMKGYDMVVSGLPHKWDMQVAEAAIEAKINGLDISGHVDPSKLGEAAKRAGITFVSGVGATPGVTNVLAKHGANKLDQVDEVHYHWAAYRCFAPSPGLVATTFWEFDPYLKDRYYYDSGEFHCVPPFSGAKKVRFADPIGEQEVYFVPHSETLTTPHSMKGVKKVDVRGTWPPETMRLLRAMIDFGLFEKEPTKTGNLSTSPREFMAEFLLQTPRAKDITLWGYAINVEVIGKKAGKNTKCTFATSHPPMEKWGGKRAYAKNVGIPMSIGAQLIANGRVKRKGVLPSDEAFEPQEFFQELSKRGIRVHEHVEETYTY